MATTCHHSSTRQQRPAQPRPLLWVSWTTKQDSSSSSTMCMLVLLLRRLLSTAAPASWVSRTALTAPPRAVQAWAGWAAYRPLSWPLLGRTQLLRWRGPLLLRQLTLERWWSSTRWVEQLVSVGTDTEGLLCHEGYIACDPVK